MKKTLLKASLIAMLGFVAFSNDFMNVNAAGVTEDKGYIEEKKMQY